MNPDGTKKTSCNITTDYEIDESHDIVSYIDYYRFRVWTSRSDEVDRVRAYIQDHQDDLYIGNQQQERIKLEKQKKEIEKRLSKINNFLLGQGWFENGCGRNCEKYSNIIRQFYIIYPS